MKLSAVRFLGLAMLLGLVASHVPAQAPTQKKAPDSLVVKQMGDLPIVLSAPHGGTKDVPGVTNRDVTGLPGGGSGYVVVRDSNTEELTYAIRDAIEKRMGKKPYMVVAQFHRKYIDANRPPEVAYQDKNAKAYYDSYRETLSEYCKDVKKTYGRGLVLDVHGQGQIKDVVIRGTRNGKTVSLLVSRFGEKAHTGPESFFGLLESNGLHVYPAKLSDKEYATLNGGNIVQTFGSGDYGLDAIQLEFGSQYREKSRIPETAKAVAAAVEKFHQLYLVDPK